MKPAGSLKKILFLPLANFNSKRNYSGEPIIADAVGERGNAASEPTSPSKKPSAAVEWEFQGGALADGCMASRREPQEGHWEPAG